MKLENIIEGTKYQLEKVVNMMIGGVMLAVPVIGINILYYGLEAGSEAIQNRNEIKYENVKLVEVDRLQGRNSHAEYLKGTFEAPNGEKFYAYDNVSVLDGKLAANSLIPKMDKDSTYNITVKEGYLFNTKVSSVITDVE